MSKAINTGSVVSQGKELINIGCSFDATWTRRGHFSHQVLMSTVNDGTQTYTTLYRDLECLWAFCQKRLSALGWHKMCACNAMLTAEPTFRYATTPLIAAKTTTTALPLQWKRPWSSVSKTTSLKKELDCQCAWGMATPTSIIISMLPFYPNYLALENVWTSITSSKISRSALARGRKSTTGLILKLSRQLWWLSSAEHSQGLFINIELSQNITSFHLNVRTFSKQLLKRSLP